MSIRSGATKSHTSEPAAKIIGNLLDEISPKSFSSNELDDVLALSDDDGTSTMDYNDESHTINTNNSKAPVVEEKLNKQHKKKIPIWIKNITTNSGKKSNVEDVISSENENNSEVDTDAARAAVEAAAAAADALGKDLEAMGYDLECRSFIKIRSQDSVLPSSPNNNNNMDGERYTSTTTTAPFSDEDEKNNGNDVLVLLRSSSDLIEATRSSSDLIEALRSKSSDDQHIDARNAPIKSLLSSGTGPMMMSSQNEDDGEMEQENSQSYPTMVVENKSLRSHKSERTYNTNKSKSRRTTNSGGSIKSYRSQKTNATNASTNRRREVIQIDQVPEELQYNGRKSSRPVIVETVTSIPSTLSQYHIQYTTTTQSGDGEMLLITSPSYHRAAENNDQHVDNGSIVKDCKDESVKEKKNLNDEPASLRKSQGRTKSKGLSKHLETGTYHGASSKLPSQVNNAENDGSNDDSDRQEAIVRCASEGGKIDPTKQRIKFQQRLPVSQQVSSTNDHGTVKSRSSFWSKKIGGSRKTWNGHVHHSPSDNDEASEVSSVATSRAAPPFQVLTIPMKKKSKSIVEIKEISTGQDTGSQRPPRIPNMSSQRSKGSVSSSKNISQDVIVPEGQGFIETKRSVDSRTLNETSPDEIEATAETKTEEVDNNINAIENDNFVERVITTVPSVESKSSAKKILKAFSMGSKVSVAQSNKSHHIERAAKSDNDAAVADVKENAENDTVGPSEKFASPTSNISIECDDEHNAKEQEQVARELILANMVERQRRLRRSMEAREKILKLVHEKENMTLPPKFDSASLTMHSMANTAPANMENYGPPVIVPPSTTSLTTMPRAAPFSDLDHGASTLERDKMCDESVVSDSTPKVRGGSRILNFLSFSPEKRPRVAKVNKSHEPPMSKVKLIQAPMFGRRRSSNKQPSTTALPNLFHSVAGKINNKKTKKQANKKSMFSLKKANTSKAVTAVKEIIPIEPSTIPPPLELPIADPHVIKKKPKVSYVDLDEEAIEVAFSKSPDSMSSTLPSMLGADAVLEKIDEEGSHDDLKSQTSGPDGAPQYSVQPLMITRIGSSTNTDKLEQTRKAALDDLKKMGATMIASTDAPTRTNGDSVIVEAKDPPVRPQVNSFFRAVDHWFFESLTGKSSVVKKVDTISPATETFPSDLVKAGKEMTEKVLSGFSFTNPLEDKSAKETTVLAPSVKIEDKAIEVKDREKTLEYLDQELKSREENSLKSLTELEEKVLNGDFLNERAIPTHLIFNHAIPDDGSCITALNSTMTRTESHRTTRDFASRKDDVSSLSDVLTMDQWNEIAEAAHVVERALKTIEQSGGLKSTKSEGLNSAPSFAFMNDGLEEALQILSKHAKRLGVSESDILMALGGSYEEESVVEPPSVLAHQLSQSPHPRPRMVHSEFDDADTATMEESAKSLTIGEEILEALQMYMAKK